MESGGSPRGSKNTRRYPPAPDEPITDEHELPTRAVLGPPLPAPPVEPPRRSHKLGWLALVAVVVLGFLYFNGNLDRPLYGIGLNFHECARNGLGATFCGSELTEYRERISQVKEETAEKTANLERESKEESAKLERESKEATAKAQQEASQEQRQLREEQTRNERETQQQSESEEE